MPSILEACQGRLPERSFGAGEIIITEGTRAGKLFILAEGTVEVVKGDYVISTLEDPGAVFGEISVLLDTVHMATVRTAVPSRFYLVDEPLEFLRSAPDVALGVARMLAKRLHAMTTYLVDLKHQFEHHSDHFGMVDEVLDALSHSQHDDHDPGSDREPDPNAY
jgi:CRP/FNR family cyclic AMP-dependent transcriptional regulator